MLYVKSLIILVYLSYSTRPAASLLAFDSAILGFPRGSKPPFSNPLAAIYGPRQTTLGELDGLGPLIRLGLLLNLRAQLA